MDEEDRLARRFEASRPRLRAMAYRMLGSLGDAEDAVQEGWLRAAGADSDDVANLEGWFTTIVARVCLDMLRSRKSRREEPLEEPLDLDDAAVGGPEQEAMLADSVGLAMLVVLDSLAPAERVAFVLHDTFGLPFGEIAAITGRTPASARQLASRARRRIQGSERPRPRRARQREVAEAFLAAARGGDLGALIAVLDPDVELRADATASPSGRPMTIRGAAAVAGGARAASARSRYGRVALINGTPGVVMAPRGRLAVALAFTYSGDKISQIDVIADPGRLEELDLAILEP
ncbi:MAG TPA: sigma-70 family RNA polymerase sigma factor [Streptosporangiaceae bacterium]|nr:sigma-70 family RNA polymerase sigma factor [Streptosporangiaceae bacterium]